VPDDMSRFGRWSMRYDIDAILREIFDGVIDRTVRRQSSGRPMRPRQIATSRGLTSAIRKSMHRSTASTATEAPVPARMRRSEVSSWPSFRHPLYGSTPISRKAS
jgi:hypothetical protein